MLRGIFTFTIILALGYSGLMIYLRGHELIQVILMILFATPLLTLCFYNKENDRLRNNLEKAEDNYVNYTILLFKIYFSRYLALFKIVLKK